MFFRHKRMIISMLIGFRYSGKEELPGIQIDLYKAYNHCLSIGIQTKDIYLLSDLEEDEESDSLFNMIIDSNIDKSAISFIETFRRENASNYLSVKNLYEFKTFIKNIYRRDPEKLFIYYTGHGVKNHIVLPNLQYFPMRNFRKYTEKLLSRNIDSMWIFDCCHPNDFGLPYYLHEDDEVFLRTDQRLSNQKILCVASAEPSETSAATNFGSLFTVTIFSTLSKTREKIDISRFSKMLEEEVAKYNKTYNIKQTMRIYSSKFEQKEIWKWVHNIKF